MLRPGVFLSSIINRLQSGCLRMSGFVNQGNGRIFMIFHLSKACRMVHSNMEIYHFFGNQKNAIFIYLAPFLSLSILRGQQNSCSFGSLPAFLRYFVHPSGCAGLCASQAVGRNQAGHLSTAWLSDPVFRDKGVYKAAQEEIDTPACMAANNRHSTSSQLTRDHQALTKSARRFW